MPFIPHTKQDLDAMLKTLKINNIEELFNEIPSVLKLNNASDFPAGLNEMQISRLMHDKAALDKNNLCFIGAGAYQHYIPAAIWEIASRGELMTAYTPYQAEASQGTLQIIYEYQTMMANLMGMDVANASLYDGASALAEAILMAVRANHHAKTKKILIPRTLHPAYRKVAKTICEPQEIEFIEIPYDKNNGTIEFSALEKYSGTDVASVIISQPNFFGMLEDVDAITNWAHAQKALVIAVVNPIAMALIKEPGAWGENGADIAVGDGQPLGCPLASGGPYFGFMCTKEEYLRSMPGRIIGKTTDLAGNVGYILTLQAREQHIRRAKATSNICTNQGLMAAAATIYLSLLGREGLNKVAIACWQNAAKLNELLIKNNCASNIFSVNNFHEFVVRLNKPTAKFLAKLSDLGIDGGYDLAHEYPELGNALLIAVTETKTADDLEFYVDAWQKVEKFL